MTMSQVLPKKRKGLKAYVGKVIHRHIEGDNDFKESTKDSVKKLLGLNQPVGGESHDTATKDNGKTDPDEQTAVPKNSTSSVRSVRSISSISSAQRKATEAKNSGEDGTESKEVKSGKDTTESKEIKSRQGGIESKKEAKSSKDNTGSRKELKTPGKEDAVESKNEDGSQSRSRIKSDLTHGAKLSRLLKRKLHGKSIGRFKLGPKKSNDSNSTSADEGKDKTDESAKPSKSIRSIDTARSAKSQASELTRKTEDTEITETSEIPYKKANIASHVSEIKVAEDLALPNIAELVTDGKKEANEEANNLVDKQLVELVREYIRSEAPTQEQVLQKFWSTTKTIRQKLAVLNATTDDIDVRNGRLYLPVKEDSRKSLLIES